MDYLRQVRRGIDYIEARLDADIDLADVARHAGL
ncbi:MAG: AraC family transcriptional regulator, partial [Myxococcales bacterium]